jgi:hypothetical protein
MTASWKNPQQGEEEDWLSCVNQKIFKSYHGRRFLPCACFSILVSVCFPLEFYFFKLYWYTHTSLWSVLLFFEWRWEMSSSSSPRIKWLWTMVVEHWFNWPRCFRFKKGEEITRTKKAQTLFLVRASSDPFCPPAISGRGHSLCLSLTLEIETKKENRTPKIAVETDKTHLFELLP